MAVFQVYPTATRALGLGTCSGMARVGALITPFIAQVGVPPKYRGGGCAKSQRVAGSYDMLSLLWGPPCVLLYFILTTRLLRKEIRLADGKTQGQKGQGTCPRSHSWEVGKLGLKPRSFPRGRPLGCHMIWLKIIWVGTSWPASSVGNECPRP